MSRHKDAGRRGDEKLLAEVESYLARTGMSASTFGHYVANDGKLVARLRNGGTVMLHTAESIRSFIRSIPRGYTPRPKKNPAEYSPGVEPERGRA